jgi:predicted Rdx family selenoprotein
VTLIKQRLNIEAVCTPGKGGQFDVIADGKRIAERGGNRLTRSFGAGNPDLETVIEQIVEKNRAGTGNS